MCEPDAHSRMYTSCLAYLLHINKIDRSRRDLWLDYPLVFHATRYWHRHAQSVEQLQNHVPPLALKFLLNEENSFATWLAMSKELGPPLYHASLHGLWRSVQILLNHQVDVNAPGGHYGTAIQVAAAHGHERIVELLISNAANVNVEFGRTPLNEAVRHGNINIVRQLLENGAHVNGLGHSDSQDDLELALIGGDEHIVQLLLDRGVEFKSWRSALTNSGINDREAVTRRLLNHQVPSNQLRSQSISNALGYAIRHGNTQAVKLLLDHLYSQAVGRDDMGCSPLALAARLGQKVILGILMTRFNHNLDAAKEDGRTILSYTADSGDAAALQMLLKHSDRDVDLADALGRTPLSYAAEIGPHCYETVALLLGHEGVDRSSQDHKGRTPLSYAVGPSDFRARPYQRGSSRYLRKQLQEEEKHKDQLLVQMLLGYDNTAVQTQDQYGWTPLSWAVHADRAHIVELLLPYGYRGLDVRRSDGETLLASTFRQGSMEILTMLSGRGAIDFEGLRDGEALISSLIHRGFVEILGMLSEQGSIDLKEPSNDSLAWDRISHAVSRGHTELVELLMKDSHLVPSSQDERGRTLISLAAEAGYERTLKSLSSVDSSTVDLPDNVGRTPLSYIFSTGNSLCACQTGKLLMDKHAVRPDLPDATGRAPISYAAGTQSWKSVEMLLNRDVDVNRPDSRGRTPLSYAAETSLNNLALKLVFEKSSTARDCADHTGRTPLSYAAGKGRRGAVRFMLRSGSVEINTPDKAGLTPLAYAEMAEDRGRPEEYQTPEVLRSYGAYRLDLEEPASEETDSCTESSGSTGSQTS